jgi:NTP pyrophosphatase (non-canonical NTP hydrolase)
LSKTLDEFQREVGEWGEKTFPQSNLLSIIRHFDEEASELVGAMEHPTKDFPDIDEEAADCFLLLLHYCHRRGVSLMELAEWKMLINRERKWTKDSGKGYVKHE